MSSAGFSCFLPLFFVSLCLSSVVSPLSLFLSAGPRAKVWDDKGMIWLFDVFLFFLSHLLSVYRSLLAGRRDMDQARAIWSKTERDRDRDNTGSNSNGGRYRRAGTPDRYLFCYFCILNSSMYSLLFFLVASFSAECNNRQGGTGHDPMLATKAMRDEGTTGTSSVLFCSSSPLFFFSLFFPVNLFSVKLL